MRPRSFAYVAAALAFCSAAVSVFWTLGGTFLIDTVGGSVESLARSRSPVAVTLGAASSLVKVGAGMLALALVRPWGRHVPDRLLVGASAVLACLLLAWGGANVVAGSLSLVGVVSPADGLDERALLWHVLVWDLWFVVWGAALTGAIFSYRRVRRHAVRRRHWRGRPRQDMTAECVRKCLVGPPQDEGGHRYRQRSRPATLK